MMSSAAVPFNNIPGIANTIPGSGENCSPSRRNRCSPSARKPVRLHPGIVFAFTPESRSPSSGIRTLDVKLTLGAEETAYDLIVRHSSPARLSPREHLELFAARVNELSQTTLVRTNGLVNEWSVSFAANGPSVFRSLQPNEDLLRSYLMTFRKFISKNEPVHVGHVHGLCHRHFTSDELKTRIRECQDGWKRTITQAGFKMDLYGKQYSSEHLADLWINGHYFHNDPEKEKELSRYAPPATFMVRQEFLNFVVEATRVVGSTGYVVREALREGSVAF
jgi:hypothetical protein